MDAVLRMSPSGLVKDGTGKCNPFAQQFVRQCLRVGHAKGDMTDARHVKLVEAAIRCITAVDAQVYVAVVNLILPRVVGKPFSRSSAGKDFRVVRHRFLGRADCQSDRSTFWCYPTPPA
ncbi:MAG: hypothetical protein F4W95_07320 [Chloroflexi bacterium]|nr:hypothetical protein [Chloroflexota bacterium]MYD48281.1 hypothetical protein [Chloroflexota bacterium]